MNNKKTFFKFFKEPAANEFAKIVSYVKKDSGKLVDSVVQSLYDSGLTKPFIADFGGGTGHLISFIQNELYKNKISSTVYCIDVDYTKSKDFEQNENKKFIISDLKKISLSDELFDRGICRLVLQYLGSYQEQIKALKEINRTLKSSGILFLQAIYASDDQVKNYMNNLLYKGREKILIEEKKMKSSLQTEILTENQFKHALAKSGFNQINVLRKVGVPQSVSELQKRFKLSDDAYNKILDLFNNLPESLKKHLEVISEGNDVKYKLPTIVIKAKK